VNRAPECDIHLVPIPEGGCVYCLRFLADPPDVYEMTTTMKLVELEQWLLSRPSVPGELYTRRIEQLVGRAISLYELDEPERLLQEVMNPSLARMWADDWT
jgi:hypothetical protein